MLTRTRIGQSCVHTTLYCVRTFAYIELDFPVRVPFRNTPALRSSAQTQSHRHREPRNIAHYADVCDVYVCMHVARAQQVHTRGGHLQLCFGPDDKRAAARRPICGARRAREWFMSLARHGRPAGRTQLYLVTYVCVSVCVCVFVGTGEHMSACAERANDGQAQSGPAT